MLSSQREVIGSAASFRSLRSIVVSNLFAIADVPHFHVRQVRGIDTVEISAA
jgi:flagellar basal body rod protein FlgB